MYVLVGAWAASLKSQLSDTTPEEAAKDSPIAWAPATHIEHPYGVPGSWFGPGPDLAIAVNQADWKSISLSLSLPSSLPPSFVCFEV